MEANNFENYETEYWKMYSTEELKAIVNNSKLLRAFREEAKKRLEYRSKRKAL
jgi:hypothetical protein